jgi:hypothetical protein
MPVNESYPANGYQVALIEKGCAEERADFLEERLRRLLPVAMLRTEGAGA